MKSMTLYVPMVSFCDIPLSQIKDHLSRYGSYGIGLTREWAVKKGLNPVLYVQRRSNLAHSYENAVLHYEQDCAEHDDAIAAFNRIADIARYTKNYEEILERKGKSHGMYRFSDEREWRYVPEIDSSCEMYYAGKNFDEDARMAASESVKDYRLDFEADDIKYIIIASEDEVPSFVDSLRDLRRFSSREVERITARVLTAEQIKSDF
ncbi:abortive infection system antitoxin AbiGi family protein [Pseudomonas syringae]|uniref:abortive infection system antitoxin AbiGi family protein n=1 Tax=Pseudomonas syringae TaxID=317 RepID=UPI003F777AEE